MPSVNTPGLAGLLCGYEPPGRGTPLSMIKRHQSRFVPVDKMCLLSFFHPKFQCWEGLSPINLDRVCLRCLPYSVGGNGWLEAKVTRRLSPGAQVSPAKISCPFGGRSAMGTTSPSAWNVWTEKTQDTGVISFPAPALRELKPLSLPHALGKQEL